MTTFLKRLARDDAGATAIEYGLIAGVVSVVMLVALQTIGTNLTAKFNAIASALN